jgi:hypothetical protein
MAKRERTMTPTIHDGHGTTSDDFLRAGHGLALGRVKRATTKRSKTQEEWVGSIRDAVELGVSLRRVADAAGVSHVRVLQLTR